jgi:hypothetical protein
MLEPGKFTPQSGAVVPIVVDTPNLCLGLTMRETDLGASGVVKTLVVGDSRAGMSVFQRTPASPP